MNIPNFHDGHFDGFRIGPNEKPHLFLRTPDGESFTLAFQGVDALTLSEIKQGNIIFDLVFRSGEELTSADIEELFDVKVDAPNTSTLLKTKRDMGLQVLELNASYGARGLVLFQTIEVRPTTPA
jgi:hypothetical protein